MAIAKGTDTGCKRGIIPASENWSNCTKDAIKSNLANYSGIIFLSKNQNRLKSSHCLQKHQLPKYVQNNSYTETKKLKILWPHVNWMALYISKKITQYVKVRERTSGLRRCKLIKTKVWPIESVSEPFLSVIQPYHNIIWFSKRNSLAHCSSCLLACGWYKGQDSQG